MNNTDRGRKGMKSTWYNFLKPVSARVLRIRFNLVRSLAHICTFALAKNTILLVSLNDQDKSNIYDAVSLSLFSIAWGFSSHFP